jgi:hypothetical protein
MIRNNAQCIIDQFIAAGERKWLQRTGLVLSLPHGYDGQGPEHSSGRIERFLQLCDDEPRIYPSPEKLDRQHQDCNMQIVYATTPANYFHVLRRQNLREFRKPVRPLSPYPNERLTSSSSSSSLNLCYDTHLPNLLSRTLSERLISSDTFPSLIPRPWSPQRRFDDISYVLDKSTSSSSRNVKTERLMMLLFPGLSNCHHYHTTSLLLISIPTPTPTSYGHRKR